MTNFKRITLALDLSLNGPGMAVVAITDGNPIVLDKRNITPTGSHGDKLTQIAEVIDELFALYEPEYVVREKGFSRFAATTQTLFKVVGISDYIAYQYGHNNVEELSPSTVKKLVTGDGNSKKDEVADSVFKAYQIDNTDDYYRTIKGGKNKGKRELIDDLTDSLAVGLAFYKTKRWVK